MLRPDLIFSYWIVLWYILYELSIIKYNPKFWLIFALFINFIQFVYMIYYKRFFMLFVFISVITVIKIIPTWRLRNTPIHIEDILFGSILFIIYYVWLLYNHYDIYKIGKILFYSIKNNNEVTPMMYVVKQITNKLKHNNII
jgi:hypothetical protein